MSIIGINADLTIVYLNAAAASELQLDGRAIMKTSFFEIFEDCSENKVATTSIKNMVPIKSGDFKLTVGGTTRWFELSSVLKSDGLAEQTAAYFCLRNVTGQIKQERLVSFFNTAVASLLKTRDTETSLQQIAELIVPTFADWFTIDIVRDEEVKLILLKHKDQEKIEWAKAYRKKYPLDLKGETAAAAVIKTGKPNFIPVLTEEMIDNGMPDPVQRAEIKKIGLHSVIMAPMSANGQTTGIINYISSRSDRHFDEEDLHFALNFTDLIGLALENARLHEEAQQEIVRRRQGEERFRFLLDAIPHKMWTSSPDGKATFYNQQWHSYTGIPGFENLRNQIWDIIHPDDIEDAARRWPEAVKQAKIIEIENRFRRTDGAYRWHLSRINPIKDDQGNIVLWVGTSTDIHEQKIYELELSSANEEITASNEELTAANEELEAATEQQFSANEEMRRTQENLKTAIIDLEQNKKRFQYFLDSIPQIAWAASANGEVRYYNQRWYDYTGLDFEQTRNWGWKQVVHPDDLPYNIQRLSEIIQSRSPGEFEIREKNRSGNYRWHLVRVTPLFDSDGNLDEWVGTATDIDELKKLQHQKDDFISIASHELKTPLTSLKATIQVLYNMKGDPEPARFRKLIEQANRSMYKMSTLVEDLLNVNRFKEVHMVPRKQWFILSELVNSSCNHLVVTGRHEIVISGDKILKVNADSHAIDQVIVNFVTNAMKYAPSSKQIEIRIERCKPGAKLSVRDYGPGIPPEQLSFVFDRYYQGGKKDYRNPGLGLGLYISSEIIKKHGGKIGVESEPGAGSNFWFTLPDAK